MAIVVQEEKKPVNWIGMLTVVFVVVALFVLSYLLFFKRPEVIEQVVPGGKFEDINKISKVNFDPEALISSESFQALKNYAPSFVPREIPGKPNPFRP